MKKSKIMLFIPMYNCEKQIRRVLKQIDAEVLNYINEVVVVDNISKDNSVEEAIIAFEELANVKRTLLLNKKNYGLGGSIKRAFLYAIDEGFDYMITLHGDDQGDIHDAINFLKTSEYERYDMCIGARFHKDSKLIGYSKFRIFGNRIFNFIAKLATGKKTDDLIAGLNIYKVELLKNRFYLKFPNTLTFDAHFLLFLAKENKSYIFFPLTWREEDQISNAKVFRQAWVLFKLFVSYFVNKENIFAHLEREHEGERYESEVVFQKSAESITTK